MAKWVDEGETDVGAVYLKGSARAATLYCLLYTDNTEPGETATLASITEVTGNGYSRQACTDGSWSEGAAGVYTHTELTFTASGGSWSNVYGWGLCDVASGTVGNLLGVETFSDSPYTVNDGWSVKLTPKVTIT